jgi:hypothetical protein
MKLNMNKKKLFLILPGILILPATAFAQVQSCIVGGPCVTSITGMIHSVEMAAGLIFGGVAVICFLIAGILFLTAGGEPEKIKQARAAFIWGVAGVIVGILAFSIIAIVLSILT